MGDRVMVFVDGSNLDRAILHCFSRRVSPELLALKLVGERRLMRVNYYESPLLPEVDRTSFDAQQRFFERLRMNPYFDVKLGRRVKREREYTCPDCGTTFKKQIFEQKGVDTLLTFDLVTLATQNSYDIAILVAGDQDFICPVIQVRMMDKYIENAFTNYAWAANLKIIADKTTILDNDFLEGCWQM